MARTAKAICSEMCKARCCSWSFIELTPEEAARLKALAKRKHLPQPEIVPDSQQPGGFVMQATPCVFLNKANLCSIYKDRPQHCRDFPDTVREWCPLSRVLFPELLPSHLRPAPLDPEPKRRAPRRHRRVAAAAAPDPDA